MMREHMGLFRGKRVDSDEWVKGGLYEQKDMHESCFFIVRTAVDFYEKGYNHAPAEFFLVYPDTVGECTGMQANGKLIFEGDILEREYLGEKHRYTVVYSRDAFAWGEKNKYGLTGRLCKGLGTIEIIGNIHDNPELEERRES